MNKLKLTFFLAALLSVSLVAQEKEDEMNDHPDRYYDVVRGDFNITLTLDGNLDAIKHHVVKCEGRGRYGLEIVEAVEDRSRVEKDSVIVRFSTDKYDEQKDKLILQIDDERKNLMLAQQDFDMEKTGIINDIKSASDKLRVAKEALAKYEEQDAVRKRKELKLAINTADNGVDDAEYNVRTAKDNLSNAQTNEIKKVEELEKKIDSAKQKLLEAERKYDTAKYNMRIFKQYDHPQKMRTLTQGVTRAEMDLQRQIVNASGKTIKGKRRIQNHELRIKKLDGQLKDLEKDMSHLIIRAPVTGILTYGNPRRRHWQQPKEVKVGVQFRRGEVIGSIPDMSRFMVNIEVPEEFRSRVKEGLHAKITTKAIPGLIMNGSISTIAPMATHILAWDKASPKIYKTELFTDSTDERLMPGMTMGVELIMDSVKDVLFLPVEAVYHREGKNYIKLKKLTGVEEVEVETGRSSNDYVEITQGIEEGDKVLLFREDSGP